MSSSWANSRTELQHRAQSGTSSRHSSRRSSRRSSTSSDNDQPAVMEADLDRIAARNAEVIKVEETTSSGCGSCVRRGLHTIWKTRDTEDTAENKELYVTTTVRELVVYIIFLIILLIVTFGMTSNSMYYLTNILSNLFLNTPVSDTESTITFNGIGSFDDYFHVFQKVFLDAIYSNSWYNDQDVDDRDKSYVFYENKMLGVPRLRQVRVRNNSCKVPSQFKNDILDCYAMYSSSAEDKEPFGPNNSTAWRYTTKDVLKLSNVGATLASYDGGGYYVDLSRNKDNATGVIADLKSSLWLRRGTRAVMLDFSVYNANVNLFCIIKLIMEFPATGGAVPYSEFRTVKLLRYVSTMDYVVLGCEGVYLLFIIYYIVEEAIEIKKHRLRYFLSFWNVLDIVVIVISILCAGFNVYRTLSVSSKLDELLMDQNAFPDFDFLSYWQLQFNNAIAIAVFFAWVKVFKYISFNKTMTQLSTTLGRCAKDLGGFAVMFFIVFLAFAQLGYLIFGYKVDDYKSFTDSIFSLFRIILGDFNFVAMRQANSILGPLFFIVYVFFVFFVLLNMFIAIINDTYAEVKEDLAQQKNDLELGDFLKEKAEKMLDKLNVKRDKIVDIQKALQEADLNNDKVLDFEEWRNVLKAKGYADGEIEAVFARYDMDGDRVLDQAEQAKLRAELEGEKADLNAEIEQERRLVVGEDADEDDEDDDEGGGGRRRRGGRGGVPQGEFEIMAGRVTRMESIVGGIIGKIDSVLERMEEMEKAKLARRQASAKLIDALTKAENLSEDDRREQLESIVKDEMRVWEEETILASRPGTARSMRRPKTATSTVGFSMDETSSPVEGGSATVSSYGMGSSRKL